jgi:membrane protein YdbS with pleckstrin-like domain
MTVQRRRRQSHKSAGKSKNSMTSALFISIILILQLLAGLFCVYEHNFAAAVMMAAGVLAQVSVLMTLGQA